MEKLISKLPEPSRSQMILALKLTHNYKQKDREIDLKQDKQLLKDFCSYSTTTSILRQTSKKLLSNQETFYDCIKTAYKHRNFSV